MKASVFFALVLLSVALAKPHRFALEFNGKATKPDASGSTTVTLKAPGQVITTKIDATYGVESTFKNLIGTKADWTSTGSFSNATTFVETSGSIAFGTHLHNDHTVQFNSDSKGHLFPAPDGEKQDWAGTAAYVITGGEGAFKGANGIMTASYTITEGDKFDTVNALVSGQFWTPDN